MRRTAPAGWFAVVLNGAAAVALAWGAAVQEPPFDPLWSSLAILAVLVTPAALAVLGLLRAPALLAVASAASLALALFPFSLHSFALLPAAALYGVSYAQLRSSRLRRREAVAVAAAAVFAPLALLSTQLGVNPMCWEAAEGGTGTLGGCTSNAVVWWEALLAVAVAAALVALSASLVREDLPAAA